MRCEFIRRLLAKTDYVESVSLLPLIRAFSEETDSCLWDLISAIVSDLKVFFDPKTEEKRRFKRFVRDLAFSNYQRLGVASRPEDDYDDTELRATVMWMLLYAEDEEYLNAVQDTYANVEIDKVDANLRCVVGATLVRRNHKLCNQYFELYKQTSDAVLKQDLVDAITTTKDRKTALGLFEHLSDGTIRTQDRLLFLLRLMRNYVVKNDALEWMYQKWDWIYEEEGDKTIPEYPRFSATYIRKKEEAEKFKKFFDAHVNEKILNRDILVAYSEIDARLVLIAADQAAIFEYLKSYSAGK